MLFANSGGTPSCWAQAVNASTSSLSFSGVIYAPNGKVGFYTNTTTSIAGAVIANSTQITGNHLNMELP